MIHPAFRKSGFVFNATYHDVPGAPRIKVDGGLTYRDEAGVIQSAWAGGYDGPNGKDDWSTRWQVVVPEKLRAFARSIDTEMFVLDVEHYTDRLGRLIDIVETIRAERPDVAIGIWSLIPASRWSVVNDYAEVVDYEAGKPHFDMKAGWWKKASPPRIAAYEAWQRGNEPVARILLPHVDFICPSIYPAKEPDQYMPEWALGREPELMIEESRRLAALVGRPDLPVLACYYPFISSTKRPASSTVNRQVLRAANPADGKIVWGDEHITPEQGAAALATAMESSVAVSET